MAIGDVWRVACRGATGDTITPPLGDHTDWVNVFHCKTFDGAGTEADEALELRRAFSIMYSNLGFQGIFGRGSSLQEIQVVNLTNDNSYSQSFEIDLEDEENAALPPQVSIALTGRDNVIGRRVTMYVASLSHALLGENGRLIVDGIATELATWFNTKFSGVWAWDCVIFDRAEVLPTIIITRWRMSPNFRTQRRRVLTTTQPAVTVYDELPG